MYQGILHHYRHIFDLGPSFAPITLCEGQTPLIRATNLEALLPGIRVHLKIEGANPTGSFKDRGMTMAVSMAASKGARGIICASTGNTSASAAAYAAKAGMLCFVIIPSGKIALGKLAQAFAYGAHVMPIEGNFDQALSMVQDICKHTPLTMVNSLNPHRLLGQQSAAFEVCDALEKAPTHVFLPVGNAGNITAYWMGFKAYRHLNLISSLPKLYGFQAEGASPIVQGKVVQQPETIATAIRIGNPASWEHASTALRESGGRIQAITDEAILHAYQLLARREGIFAEPASCISIAGLLHAYEQGRLKACDDVVCILTGNGLKDPEIAMTHLVPQTLLPISQDALQKRIEVALNGEN